MTRELLPTTSGPLDGGRKGWIFGSPDLDQVATGLVMEEYLLSGEASAYDAVPGTDVGLDGLWSVEPSETRPYTTRAYVVRPADPSAFNGVALVNWQNVTIGVDLGMPDLAQVKRGYAWVGVTTQRVAVEGQQPLGPQWPTTIGLREWDPERYGSLDHPGDAHSYDIFSQAARLLRESPSALLGDLSPGILIATGGSQSAMRLGSYINMVHQRDRLIDGFLLTVHWGHCPRPPDMTLVESFQLTDDSRPRGISQIRDDGGVPILLVNSESETTMMSAVRQPDSPTFRFWELPGTAHASGASADSMAAVLTRDGLTGALEPVEGRNTVGWDYIADAALERLVEWIKTKTPPASFPPIELEGGNGAIRRDEVGNAVGGVRLPEVVAPLAVHTGSNALGSVGGLQGESKPMSRAQIAARYSDRAAYVAAWDKAVDDLTSQGLVLDGAVLALKERGRDLAGSHFTHRA